MVGVIVVNSAGFVSGIRYQIRMGVCCSSTAAADLEQKKRSQLIDKGLEDDMKRLRRECKILLLGP